MRYVKRIDWGQAQLDTSRNPQWRAVKRSPAPLAGCRDHRPSQPVVIGSLDRCAIQLNDGRTAAQGHVSGYAGADVFCEHTMNQGLVADLEALGLGAESRPHLGVQADGNELSSLATDRRATDTSHRAQLPV